MYLLGKPFCTVSLNTETQLKTDRSDILLNNDILRSIRYSLNLGDSETVTIFGLGDFALSGSQIESWFVKEDDPAYRKCTNEQLTAFLNGLIIHRRGKKEGVQPAPVQSLTNNAVFTKLRIALNLKAKDIMEIMDMTDLHLGRHELSSLFRKPDHKHYRNCKDDVLNHFLKGVELKFRGCADQSSSPVQEEQLS